MPAEETGISPKTQSKIATGVCQATDSILSPGFRSVAALAGWDEESLLAGLVVEDTPERDGTKHRKRSIHPHKTPPTDSRRKRRARKSNAVSMPVVVLRLDDGDETSIEGTGAVEENKEEEEEDESKEVETSGRTPDNETSKAVPCMDQLREELSCAICLEICFEPSTTPCGHSFCLKCLKCSAAKCGKHCPKCRQLISNGRACTVNTVLWNTIQLLFPKEVEARKAAGASKRQTGVAESSPDTGHDSGNRRTTRRRSGSGSSGSFILSSELVGVAETTSGRGRTQAVESSRGRRTVSPSQLEDAALALRLQREEFMRSVAEVSRRRRRRREVIVEDRGRSSPPPPLPTSSVHSARASLRAMAFRAVHVRGRSRHS